MVNKEYSLYMNSLSGLFDWLSGSLTKLNDGQSRYKDYQSDQVGDLKNFAMAYALSQDWLRRPDSGSGSLLLTKNGESIIWDPVLRRVQ